MTLDEAQKRCLELSRLGRATIDYGMEAGQKAKDDEAIAIVEDFLRFVNVMDAIIGMGPAEGSA